jgi:hydrogenase maturation protease
VKILVAGIGNIFQGDDAFGCEVVKILADRALPDHVTLFDYGIRGLDLTYALLDNPDLAILIDATPQGCTPGTLYTIEPEWESGNAEEFRQDGALETHGMNPVQVLRAAREMGARPGRILLVGCEPGDLGGEEGWMGLTPPVAAALSEAADMVEALICREARTEVLV